MLMRVISFSKSQVLLNMYTPFLFLKLDSSLLLNVNTLYVSGTRPLDVRLQSLRTRGPSS